MAPARFLIPGSINISCIKLAVVIENSKLILPQLRGPSPCPRAQRESANVKLTFVPPRARVRVRSSAIRFIRNSIVQSVPNALFRCLPHSLRFIIVCLSGDRRSPSSRLFATKNRGIAGEGRHGREEEWEGEGGLMVSLWLDHFFLAGTGQRQILDPKSGNRSPDIASLPLFLSLLTHTRAQPSSLPRGPGSETYHRRRLI